MKVDVVCLSVCVSVCVWSGKRISVVSVIIFSQGGAGGHEVEHWCKVI